jgi:hypothetical protein
MNKQLILSLSFVFTILATIIGVTTTLIVKDPLLVTKLFSVAGMVGLASIGTFFIGIVFPKDIK